MRKRRSMLQPRVPAITPGPGFCLGAYVGEDEILDKLTGIFQDVLDDDEIELTPATVADDVDGWDSLAHVRLMIAVGRAFNVNFAAAEIGRLKDVGDLIQLVTEKLDKR